MGPLLRITLPNMGYGSNRMSHFDAIFIVRMDMPAISNLKWRCQVSPLYRSLKGSWRMVAVLLVFSSECLHVCIGLAIALIQ